MHAGSTILLPSGTRILDRCPPPNLPRKKDGSPKRRLSWADKLAILDPDSPAKATEARLDEFLNLFAFRRTRAIVTKIGGDHRLWTELKIVPLDRQHVARHLLAGRASPILEPQWFGARSLATSLFYCFDVDPDRDGGRGTPSLIDRCRHVEKALRRLGIDPSDPRQVLVVPSPSGGRHYYLFFDGPHPLDQYRALFESAGLRHSIGQIEFFPSETKGLRLPFGHTPGIHQDSRAWIQFIDDFKNKKIARHSLQVLQVRLERHMARRRAKHSVPAVVETSPATKSVVSSPPILGIPKCRRTETVHDPGLRSASPGGVDRYRSLIERGVQTFREAEELLELGILLTGTRNAALNELAAHMVWFRNFSASQAAEFLTRWSIDRRHTSVDIRSDLDHGTSRVGTQISYMCAWYADRKRTRSSGGLSEGGPDRFAPAEVEALRESVLVLPFQDRVPQAQFLLHFLAFAKRNGRVAADGSGREAAAAITKVVKLWPGCGSKNYYKVRMTRAEEAGIFAMVREKWQNPHGLGRARTYRLIVPVVAESEWTLGYDEALSVLAGLSSMAEPRTGPQIDHDSERGDQTHESAFEFAGGRDPQRSGDPRPVHPRGPIGGLGQDSRPCDPQPPPPEGLSDQGPGDGPAVPPVLLRPKLIVPAVSRRPHRMNRNLAGESCHDQIRRLQQEPGPDLRERQSVTKMCRAYEEATRRKLGILAPSGPDRGWSSPPRATVPRGP